MRIGIDARFYGTIGKGLGRYTQKLIQELEKIDKTNFYFIFLRQENWNEFQPKNRNFMKILADIPWYGFSEQLLFPKILKKYRLDLVHFPHFNVPVFYRGKFVATIHDLILFHYPTQRASTLSSFSHFFKKIAHRFVIKKAIKNSRAIIAVSKHTKKDIEKNFEVDSRKIFITYEAANFSFKQPKQSSKDIFAKYGIMKPYILYVGNAYPHKNLERLVLVFRNLSQKHPILNLVLVGKEDYFYRRLKKFVLEKNVKNVIFTDFIPDRDLGTVYKEALLYVFPSLYEGFGLPPLEAMQNETPVASSSASCLPEILGDAALYFDPRTIVEMGEVIEKALTDEKIRTNLIQKGKQQVQKYSWSKMAQETMEIYKNTLQG